MDVIVLDSNRPPDRFYRGGRRITEFRGEPAAGPREPEDWIASVTSVAGAAPVGLTTLPDGRLLVDAIRSDPLAWLGADHVAKWGDDPMLLVKLLDAGQRLPVHAHPDDAFAVRHLGVAHGKAEAWYILRGGEVHLGLERDTDGAELTAMLTRSDTSRLLDRLHRVPVASGDVVYVPPGVLHAIGEGVLLLELQQPSDLSILLEWAGFDIDGPRLGHLGLGYPLALQAVETHGRTTEALRRLVRPAGFGASVLPAEADPFFRLERISVDEQHLLEPGFAVLVVPDGVVGVETAAADRLELARGATAVAPHAAGALRVSGRGELLVCRPPRP